MTTIAHEISSGFKPPRRRLHCPPLSPSPGGLGYIPPSPRPFHPAAGVVGRPPCACLLASLLVGTKRFRVLIPTERICVCQVSSIHRPKHTALQHHNPVSITGDGSKIAALLFCKIFSLGNVRKIDKRAGAHCGRDRKRCSITGCYFSLRQPPL